MKNIIESINSSNLKIGIVGDSMLDEYFNVNVRKISPEFPDTILRDYIYKHNKEADMALVVREPF